MNTANKFAKLYEKSLTEVKIFQKVVGEGATFLKNPVWLQACYVHTRVHCCCYCYCISAATSVGRRQPFTTVRSDSSIKVAINECVTWHGATCGARRHVTLSPAAMFTLSNHSTASLARNSQYAGSTWHPSNTALAKQSNLLYQYVVWILQHKLIR